MKKKRRRIKLKFKKIAQKGGKIVVNGSRKGGKAVIKVWRSKPV